MMVVSKIPLPSQERIVGEEIVGSEICITRIVNGAMDFWYAYDVEWTNEEYRAIVESGGLLFHDMVHLRQWIDGNINSGVALEEQQMRMRGGIEGGVTHVTLNDILSKPPMRVELDMNEPPTVEERLDKLESLTKGLLESLSKGLNDELKLESLAKGLDDVLILQGKNMQQIESSVYELKNKHTETSRVVDSLVKESIVMYKNLVALSEQVELMRKTVEVMSKNIESNVSILKAHDESLSILLERSASIEFRLALLKRPLWKRVMGIIVNLTIKIKEKLSKKKKGKE